MSTFSELCKNYYNNFIYTIYLFISGVLFIFPIIDIKYGSEYKEDDNCEIQMNLFLGDYLIIKGIFLLITTLLMLLHIVFLYKNTAIKIIQIIFFVCILFLFIWFMLLLLWYRCITTTLSSYKYTYIICSHICGLLLLLNLFFVSYKLEKIIERRYRPIFYEELIV